VIGPAPRAAERRGTNRSSAPAGEGAQTAPPRQSRRRPPGPLHATRLAHDRRPRGPHRGVNSGSREAAGLRGDVRCPSEASRGHGSRSRRNSGCRTTPPPRRASGFVATGVQTAAEGVDLPVDLFARAAGAPMGRSGRITSARSCGCATCRSRAADPVGVAQAPLPSALPAEIRTCGDARLTSSFERAQAPRRLPTRSRLLVQRVDLVAVALRDRAPLELQDRREFGSVGGPVAGEDGEALDLLGAGQPLVGARDGLFDCGLDRERGSVRRAGGRRDPDIASPPTVAFDPLTGRPTVAWAARPNGVDPSMGVGRTAVLRFATREAP
jgi:hypothetical protein